MALEPDQPSRRALRAILGPWAEGPAAWLVLLSVGVAALAPAGGTAGLASLGVCAGLACAAAWCASRFEDLPLARRRAWAVAALALVLLGAGFVAGLAFDLAGPAWLRDAARLLPEAFAAAGIAAVLLFHWSTRGRGFSTAFWCEAAAVALCTGTALWLALPDGWPANAWPLAALVMLSSALLLRRSDWYGWPGLAAAALALAALPAGLLFRFAEAAPAAGRLPQFALAGIAVAAWFDWRRTARQSPPMDAGERGSPLAPLVPYAALVLAGALLFGEIGGDGPRGLLAAAACAAATLLLARQALATAAGIAAQSGLARRSAEARFAALIRNTSDVIAVVDDAGVFSYLTPTAERIFGRPAQSLLGHKLLEFVAFDDRPRLRDFLGRDLAPAGASAHVEARIPRGEDRHRIVEIHGSNMLHEPAIGGLLLNLRDMTDRKGMEEQLKRLALHDPLTLLANRSLFRDRLEHAIAVSRRSGRAVAVLFVDLDNFKNVNDSLGHATGDRVLHRCAQRLVKSTRNGDTVARFGGDEFAVLLENLSQREQAVEIAARIVETLQESLDLPGPDMRVTASVGVAFAGPEDGVEELMRNADLAMYSAKAGGKGRYTVYEPSMVRAVHRRQELEAEIGEGMRGRQFLIHYLPTVELHSGVLLGVEALLRWQHPQRGLLQPADFVPVAEQSGQIVTLGRWVLAQACREVRVWQTRLPEGRQVRVSVNVSAVQLAQSDLAADVLHALELSELDPGNLVIELKEGVLMQNGDEVLAKLTELRQLGVRIAIDDFGTGLSSLSYLHRFPIDILKIDRSFVERLGRIDDGVGLARAIIALGETLGLEVVAEGIELERQVRDLIDLGCVAGQGYYYARPGLLHELEGSVHMARRRTMADTLPQGARFTATGRFVIGDLNPADLEFAATGTDGREPSGKDK